tara:strand:+ start:4717 stop:6561 length:1845 start_codon:yes stop_codon:yes gene_type:complete
MLNKRQIKGLIETHKAKSHIDQRDWDRVRSWYTSNSGSASADIPQGASDVGAEDDLSFQTNYPYAFVDTMVANICPNNPEVTVNARRRHLHEAAKYREALINDTMGRVRGHRILWRAATMASVYPRSFVKTVWNFKRRSPDFLVIDPRYVWYDMSVDRWEDIRYIIEVTVLTRQDFESRVQRKGSDSEDQVYNPEVADKAQFGGYPEWLKDQQRDRSLMNESSKEVFEWVTVYEIYDFAGNGKYYHYLEEQEEPLFAGDLPYRFVRNPFYRLTFNDNLENIGGLSDVTLIAPVLERLNELDTLMLWFAQTAIPITMLNTGLVDNPERIRSQLRDATSPGSIVEVAGKSGASMQDIIGHTMTPSLSPEFIASRDRCIQVIEFILGIPQYSRGVVGVSDVATEVALADTATRTRNGRRQQEVYDLISWQAQGIVGLYEEFLADDEILPVRLLPQTEVIEITRASMLAREVLSARGEEPLEYDYLAVPYSPTENNRLVQLRNLSQYFELLSQSPQIDQDRLVRKLTELLQMDDIVKSQEQIDEEARMAEQQAQQAQAAAAGPPGGGQDTIASGALPPGTEPVMPPLPGGVGEGGGQSPLTGFGGAPFDLDPNIPRNQ